MFNKPMLVSRGFVSSLKTNVKFLSFIQDKPLTRKQSLSWLFDDDYKAKNFERITQVVGSNAFISIEGLIVHKESWWSAFFNEISTVTITDAIQACIDNKSIEKIYLVIDSHGGEVDGISNLANFIKANNKKKKICAVVTAMCASAAYWVASACDKIYTTEETNQVGSIGVIFIHFSYEDSLKKEGVIVSHIQHGELKSTGSKFKHLKGKELLELQKQVDSVGEIFTKFVSESRKIDQEKIKNLEAAIFLSNESLINGLTDGNINIRDLKKVQKKKGYYMEITNEKILAFKEDQPEMYAALMAKGKAKTEKSVYKEAKDKGVKEESDRQTAIRSSCPKGMEALADEFCKNTSITASEAKLKFAEKIIENAKKAESSLKNKNKKFKKDTNKQIATAKPKETSDDDKEKVVLSSKFTKKFTTLAEVF